MALYRDTITSCCSDQLAMGRRGSSTHEGLGTLGNTGLPKARLYDPFQSWDTSSLQTVVLSK